MKKISLADLTTLLNSKTNIEVRFTGDVLLMDGREPNSALPFYKGQGMFCLKKLSSRSYILDLVQDPLIRLITSQFIFQLNPESRGVEVTYASDGVYANLPIILGSGFNLRIRPNDINDLTLH